MNVLVYSGPGTTATCVKQTVDLLRFLLPSYAVSSASASLILEQPWENKTACIVIPGGADLPICKEFNGKGNEKIKKFVQKGGKYIGICSGGYYASKRCEFDVGGPLEVSGLRELAFYPGTCRGGAKSGFKYGSEEGARAITIDTEAGEVTSYLNGGGLFVTPEKFTGVKVLAKYRDVDVDHENSTKAAIVLCDVGKGKALLFGPHIEFDPDNMEKTDDAHLQNIMKELKRTKVERLKFFTSCLEQLGFKTNHELERPKLTPLFLTSFDDKCTHDLINKLETNIGYYSQEIMDFGHDKFHIHNDIDELSGTIEKCANIEQDPDLTIKQLFVCGSNLPSPEMTPFFSVKNFQNHMKKLYEETSQQLTPTSIGSNFLYGEVLTSTSALMDSNAQLLRNLPSGFTIYGTSQVLGKGRSGNHWINPKGVLATSFLVHLPVQKAQVAPIVFIQYLSAMAYTKAILTYSDKAKDIPVKIKWPNDIYIMLPEFIGKEIPKDSKSITHAKIGGILVNTNMFDGNFLLVVGAGLNVGNESPTTSLNEVVSAMNDRLNLSIEHFNTEKLLAGYLTHFNQMYEKFVNVGFEPFLKEYYSFWFHSGQNVQLHDQGGVKAKIIGITPDWGMLMVKQDDNGRIWELQPDGNSFDMFRGLISKKR